MVGRITTLTAAMLVAVGMMAVPAQAHHVAEITSDEECHIGYFASPIPGVRLEGRVTSVVVTGGAITSFMCQFEDLPRYAEGGDRGDLGEVEDWYAPRQAVRIGAECWAGDYHQQYAPSIGYGRGTMTPSGNATLRCRLHAAGDAIRGGPAAYR